MTLIAVNGVQLFCSESGEGTPVVMIPGLGATHASFAGLVGPLSKDFRTMALDLRGVGKSDRPQQQYDMELWADDVAAVIESVGGPAHVIGSSLGGCVAMVLAHRRPDLVRSLVLAATFPEIDRTLELNYRVRIELIRKTGMGQLFADYAACSLYGRTFFETDEGRKVASQALAITQSNQPELYIEHLYALLRFGRLEPGQEGQPRFTRSLKDIRCPALVICGEEDVLTVPKFSKLLAENLPRSRLEILKDCGHAVFREQPALCSNLIGAFYAGS